MLIWIKSSQFRTLSHLVKHLYHLSKSSEFTGMNCRNLAIVWAPNLLRSLHQDIVSEESLKDIGDQAKVIECFIENYPELFHDNVGLTSELPMYDSSTRSHKEQRKVGSLSHQNLFTDPNMIKKRSISDSVSPCQQNQGPFSTIMSTKPPHTSKVRKSMKKADSFFPEVLCRPLRKVSLK